jgi:hypothetical protein
MSRKRLVMKPITGGATVTPIAKISVRFSGIVIYFSRVRD